MNLHSNWLIISLLFYTIYIVTAQNEQTLAFQPIVDADVGEPIYVRGDYLSDVILTCGMETSPNVPVIYNWEVNGVKASSDRGANQLRINQVEMSTRITCLITSKYDKSIHIKKTTDIIVLTNAKCKLKTQN